jgi:hypothetical protein
MKALFSTLVWVAFLSLSLAEEAPNDTTIVVGERVGPIKPPMTPPGLKTAFGLKSLGVVQLDGPEGTTVDGIKIFPGTEKELEVVLETVVQDEWVSEVRILGKAWKFSNGLKAGMTLAEAQKINGRLFKVSGFDWDYGGCANFQGGKLGFHVSVRFSPTGESYSEKIAGDVQIRSDDKTRLAAEPIVTAPISVMFEFPQPK